MALEPELLTIILYSFPGKGVDGEKWSNTWTVFAFFVLTTTLSTFIFSDEETEAQRRSLVQDHTVSEKLSQALYSHLLIPHPVFFSVQRNCLGGRPETPFIDFLLCPTSCQPPAMAENSGNHRLPPSLWTPLGVCFQWKTQTISKDSGQILVQMLTFPNPGDMVSTGTESSQGQLATCSGALVHQQPFLHRCLLCNGLKAKPQEASYWTETW